MYVVQARDHGENKSTEIFKLYKLDLDFYHVL